MGSWTRCMPGQGACGGEVLGTAGVAGWRRHDLARSSGCVMPSASQATRTGSGAASQRLVLFRPLSGNPRRPSLPPAPWAAIVVQGSKAELRPEAGRGHGQRPSAASTRTPRSALCSSESYVSLSPRRLSATVPAPHPCPISSVVTWTRSALRGHTETCFARFRGTAGFQV